MSAVLAPVNFAVAARRHHADAKTLSAQGRDANAGQLFGLAVECGLKALLIVSGVTPDASGSLPRGNAVRTHMPALVDQLTINGHLIPDGPTANHYLAMIPGRANFTSWSVEQRYWHDGALPLGDLPGWAAAAAEMGNMLDQATQDGKL
jgi:hypothetical protein